MAFKIDSPDGDDGQQRKERLILARKMEGIANFSFFFRVVPIPCYIF